MVNEGVFSQSNLSEDPRASRFFKLFIKCQKQIYTFIIMLIPNASDADDIMQETATVMWSKFDEFREGSNFAAWGIRIAHYQVLYYFRKRKHAYVKFTSELLEKITQQAVEILKEDEDECMTALRKCINKLSAKDKHILQMRYEKDIVPKEIARQLGRSVMGIYKSMSRIHDFLLQCVRRQLATEGNK